MAMMKTGPARLAIPEDDFDSLGVTGTAKLVSGLMESVATNLVRIGRAVRWLDSQGWDVSLLEACFGRGELRAIAEGQMLPEVYLKLDKSRAVRRAVCTLPHDLQRELIAGKPIEVAERGADGEVTMRKILVEHMTPELVPQVFDDGRIRSVQEQIAAMVEPLAVVNAQPVELESLLAEDAKQSELLKYGDRRQKKAAAREKMKLCEKIQLLVS